MNTSALFEKGIIFLENHRGLNFALVFAYSAFVVLMHDSFVKLSIIAMNSLSLQVYNERVKTLSIIMFVFLLVWIVISLIKHSEQWEIKITFLSLSCVFLVLHSLVMFEMNIEIIHSFEYAILVFLLFPFTRQIGATLALALPVMIIDELNQYLILYPNYNMYFEISDILLDIIGSGTFMVMLTILGVKTRKRLGTNNLLALIVLALFVLVSFGGIATGFFALHDSVVSANTIFSYSHAKSPELFWHVHQFTKAKYHILKPIEGTLLITLAIIFYFIYDSLLFE